MADEKSALPIGNSIRMIYAAAVQKAECFLGLIFI